MHLYRFVIGIQFNKKIFRLPSLGGILIDELLDFSEKDSNFGHGYFTQVSTPKTQDNQYSISLRNDDKSHNLSIMPEQFIFKKTAGSSSTAAVSIDTAINEFQKLWKIANKISSFPETRRIGFVGEYRIEKEDNSGTILVDKLTKFTPPASVNRFQLTYEDRELTDKGLTVNKQVDDFWNYIYAFYQSEMDETPTPNNVHANIDVQKYYNPAKIDPLKELRLVKDRYLKKKNEFKASLKDLGLVENE